MKIFFKACRYKNFLGAGNAWTEIVLDDAASSLFIGVNGAGKSTLLDALSYALWGKPYRDTNIPNLVNSINNKNLLVECEFDIGQKQYKIVRGIKPAVFEIYCDDKLVNVDARGKDYQRHLEEHILRWNKKSFEQIVVLGSASYVPFMKLPAAGRRAVIEDLLDITVFSQMMKIAKEKLKKNKDQLNDLRYQIDVTKEKIKVQDQAIAEAKKDNSQAIKDKKAEIENLEVDIEVLERTIGLMQNQIDDLEGGKCDKTAVQAKLRELLEIEAEIKTQFNSASKELDFYEKNNICPTCHQTIEVSFKQEKIEKHNKYICEVRENRPKLVSSKKKLNDKLSEIEDTEQLISQTKNKVVQHNLKIENLKNSVKKLEKEIDKLSQKRDNSDIDNLRLVQLNQELSEFTDLYESCLLNKEYLEASIVMLKDSGIKSGIIKQYLPVMNKLINYYLEAMSFFCNFTLDENFDEIIKSRYRDEFRYGNFSEGEKLRIDLSILLTWRAVAKLKNSMDTNLLFLDEILDRSLDENGIEEFIGLTKQFNNDTNIFIFSPKAEHLRDKFDRVIRFEKKNNFSVISNVIRNN